ncbi:hypothetical protein V502_08193, partial [Pseudogymnoascus sp. VKM F-4520 (FW-2644)]
MFYDSSAACDSFQLGEMVKFFVNKNFFAFTSPLLVTEEDYPEPAAEHIVGECGGRGTLPTYKERGDGCTAQARGVSDVERFVEELLCGGQLGLDARRMRVGSGTLPTYKERCDGRETQTRGVSDVERFVEEPLFGEQLRLNAGGMRGSADVRVIIGHTTALLTPTSDPTYKSTVASLLTFQLSGMYHYAPPKPTEALTKGYDGKLVTNILRGSEKGGIPRGKEGEILITQTTPQIHLVANSYHPTTLMTSPFNNSTPQWQLPAANNSSAHTYAFSNAGQTPMGALHNSNFRTGRASDTEFRRHPDSIQAHSPISLPGITLNTSPKSTNMFSSLKASLRRKKSNLSTSSRNS